MAAPLRAAEPNHHYKEPTHTTMTRMLVNPVVAMFYNTKLKRWHPVIYEEKPLPGPESPDKPARHKSVGHHTDGFEKREDAMAYAETTAKKIVEGGMWAEVKMSVKPEYDMAWDGEDIPADVAFFVQDGYDKLKVKRAF